MDSAEILERAADEMERRGKTREGYCDSRGRVCVIGAVAIIHGVPANLPAICEWDNLSSLNATPEWRSALIEAFNGCIVWSDRNDAPTVIAGLRAVAATLRAQSCRDSTAVTTDTRALISHATAQAPAAEPER